MIRALTFYAHDLRVTWRDGSNRIFLLIPPLFILLLQFAVPPLLLAYPEIIPYGPAILTWTVIQGGILFGFVTGFTLLKEKDQGLVAVYRVAPLRFRNYLLRKISLPYFATVGYALIALHFNPLLSFRGWPLISAAVTFSLLTPVMALLVGALGRNKVEGLTWFKALDILVLAPLLIFFLPEGWQWCFAVTPTYWSILATDCLAQGNWASFYLFLGVGAVFQMALSAWRLYLFQRRSR